ncbi:YbaB/EbfC family DNA-binding protein [Nocardia sp. NBC_01730]|uniref:YbaB/EbfC family DNA-binding protein n=1 Tax=Nocardia sp. NBC_01730 TaxID=2975998 RepID=UPI002E10593F|nr:YbaB/EbfC family DNA-binding protein [Nocardia sp. NBC_01730]
MTDDLAAGQLIDLLDTIKAGIASIGLAQQQAAALTATVSVARRQVAVSVNAEGVVIDVRFGDEIDQFDYREIARAVCTAAQAAAVEVQSKRAALMARLDEEQARMPKLSEFLPGMPDVLDMIPPAPVVATAPPGAAEEDADEDAPMEFTDVEEWDHEPSENRSGITDAQW